MSSLTGERKNKMADKVLRVVQVGTHHDHAPAPISTFDHMEGFELLGIINDTDEPGDSMHPMFNEPHADNVPEYITWEKAFELKPDAFIIETCEHKLVENAIRALEAGYHVYMDKPGSEDSAQFHRMCDIAKEKNLVLCLGYMYRYNAAVQHALKRKEEGAFGEIFSVEAQMSVRHRNDKRQWLDRFEGGMMYFLGCHLIDLVVHFCGFPEEVVPFNTNTGIDGNDSRDLGFCVLKYKNGVSFVKTCATEINGYARRQLVINGSLGSIEIKPLEMNLPDDGWKLGTYAVETLNNEKAWVDNGTPIDFDHYHRYDAMFKEFRSYVLGEKKNPYSYDYEAKLHDLILECCK